MTTTGRTTFTKSGRNTGGNWKAIRSDEILVVTYNSPGTFENMTNTLGRNNINVECFTSYAWGNEVAFRFVTDNNKKAREIFANAGYNVQEHPVVLWYTEYNPNTLGRATTAFRHACIDTYCSYMTVSPDTNNTIVAFDTNDVNKTINVLNEIC